MLPGRLVSAFREHLLHAAACPERDRPSTPAPDARFGAARIAPRFPRPMSVIRADWLFESGQSAQDSGTKRTAASVRLQPPICLTGLRHSHRAGIAWSFDVSRRR